MLSVTYGQMESGSAHRLATGLSHHPTLKRLHLRGNSIKMQVCTFGGWALGFGVSSLGVGVRV